jgi:orotate phosphoribosyltransferase
MDKTATRRQLKEMLCSISLQMNAEQEYELHSGGKSSVYVDAKITTCSPKAIPLVGRVFLNKIEELRWAPEAVGGLTVGADPIAIAIARESLDTDYPLKAFIVRKEAKKHGTKKFIEGLAETDGCRVVIIDDVCTKGDSTAQAIEKALKARMVVLGAICLVDREQGASDLLSKNFDVCLERIFTLSELVSTKASMQKVEHASSLGQ